MLKRYGTFIYFFRLICDTSIIAITWLLGFYCRYHLGIFSTAKGVPDFKRHVMLTFPVVLICLLCNFFVGLYKPKRTQNIFFHLIEIFKASFFSWLCLLAFLYYLQSVPYSRKLLSLFVVMLFVGLIFSHIFSISIMRFLRKKGYNLRHYAVIGTGPRGQQLVKDIEKMDWMGLRCAFFIDDLKEHTSTKLLGVRVFGPIERLASLVKSESIDEVYLTLDGVEAQKAFPVLKAIQSSGITIRIMPDWGGLTSISDMNFVSVGSQILFSAGDSKLDGVNAVLKEIFDRTVAIGLLFVLAVPMAIIAILIKLADGGDVFYTQKRIGLGRQEFKIIKFRTMKENSDEENEHKWTSDNDPRRTKLGMWLRKFSLDELPQLINVTKGEMSLVGPRPERPVLALQFSEEYKNYMFRHKVKAGMTGWAQVNGLRGNTSLKKRLLYDMYYVRNWSWMLDIWILLQTPWQVIKGKNAY